MLRQTSSMAEVSTKKSGVGASIKLRVYRFIKRRSFAETYLAIAVVIALLTTVYWSMLGARIHQTNADQLVDPYLFNNWQTFHSASFPGAHTFLIKWPLFALIGLIGITPTTLLVATVGICVLTVACLVGWICKIERRPLVAGTLILALTSVLLLVPAVPYAGGILPVNMAMLATRNIEYIVYGIGLWAIIRSQHIRSRRFTTGVLVLALLFASDKLFLSLSAGAALIGLVVYALAQHWRLVTLFVRWLLASIVAGLLAYGLLAAINISGLTHIAGESTANPYGIVDSSKTSILALIYAFFGLLTNFGANPAFDATQLADIILRFGRRLVSTAGPAYIINICMSLIAGVAMWRLAHTSLKAKRPKSVTFDAAFDMALCMIWSTLAAIGVFVLSKHYYAVDARYLTIALFAGFATLAVMTRKRTWRPQLLVGLGVLFLLAISCALIGTFQMYQRDQGALQPYMERNATIAQVLARHHVDTVVGDYWRVLPLTLVSHNKLDVTPLASCTSARTALSSDAWNVDLARHSFAYVLSLDQSLTDFPRCSLSQVVSAYGQPNAAILIAGEANNPKELLLIYDRGKQPHRQDRAPQVVSSVTPISVGDVPNTSCEGPTTLTIVAHQDDDLLFMNPDQLHDIQAGHCVRTVYLTAGDGGHDKFYWLSREQGSEAAYDRMIGTKKGWLQQTLRLPGGQYIAVATPLASSKVSLMFLHLPDGNLTGNGFAGSHHESLERLYADPKASIHSVDHQSTYTSQTLTQALQTIMQLYQPAQIRTQATVASPDFPDHSDHMATSRFAQKAYEQYLAARADDQVAIPLLRYIGYPVRDMPANVTEADLAQKQAAFFAYARFDGAVCYSMRDCSNTPTYWDYLGRQYIQE